MFDITRERDNVYTEGLNSGCLYTLIFAILYSLNLILKKKVF